MTETWKRYPVDTPLNITHEFGAFFRGRQHMGVDFGQPSGTPIYAPCDFTVIPVFNPDGSFGNAVAGDWDDTKWFVLFAHMRDVPLVKVGDRVKAGQQIGFVGSTGDSTGAHLHWQVGSDKNWPRDLAVHIDPMSIPLESWQAVPKYTANAGYRLRDRPAQDGTIVHTFEGGEELTIGWGSWVPVTSKNGKFGWIWKDGVVGLL
ncbi:MAG: peptidoglycan DD-metalloendopeptidase family protein [Dehalococcoidia bacterium]